VGVVPSLSAGRPLPFGLASAGVIRHDRAMLRSFVQRHRVAVVVGLVFFWLVIGAIGLLTHAYVVSAIGFVLAVAWANWLFRYLLPLLRRDET